MDSVNIHISKFKDEFDWINTTIIDIEPNYKKRSFSELLFIKNFDNTINKKRR